MVLHMQINKNTEFKVEVKKVEVKCLFYSIQFFSDVYNNNLACQEIDCK